MPSTELYHPQSYRQGVRILMLRGRLKDGTPNRVIQRVSYDEADFKIQYASLMEKALPNERIYAAAGARNTSKAIRLFRERQLASEFDQKPVEFYRGLENSWISALMAPTSQGQKLWMFDCDCALEDGCVQHDLAAYYDRPFEPYWYNTKTGRHCIVQPFDKSKLSFAAIECLHDNPLMLWAYSCN